MGTFIIRPITLDSNDHWYSFGVGTVLQGFQSQVGNGGGETTCESGPGVSSLARLGFVGNSIYLDGSITPISFSGIPAGFTPTAAVVKGSASNGGNPSGQVFFQGSGILQESASNQFYDYFALGANPSIFNLYFNGMGVRTIDTGTGFSQCFNARVEGTYVIVTQTWTLNGNPSPHVATVNSEDLITLASTAGGLTALDFTHLSSISVQYIDLTGKVVTTAVTPTTQTSNLYTFLLTQLVNADTTKTISIIGVGDGTQFSGAVTLGTLIVLIANASGIYVITSGKTADTFYTNSAANNATLDVKIPDPFIKTAFIP